MSFKYPNPPCPALLPIRLSLINPFFLMMKLLPMKTKIRHGNYLEIFVKLLLILTRRRYRE